MHIKGKFLIVLLGMFSALPVFAREKEVQLKDDERKVLNRYFTQFSEAYLSPFESEGLSSREVIRFAVSHLYKTRENLFVPENESSVKIDKKYVEEVAGEKFGIFISQHETLDNDLKYKSGFYIIPVSSGEAFVFSQVSKLVDEGSGLYTAYVKTYTASSGFTGDPNADEAAWAKDGEVPEPGKKMKALIRKIGMGSFCTYLLLEYLEAE